MIPGTYACREEHMSAMGLVAGAALMARSTWRVGRAGQKTESKCPEAESATETRDSSDGESTLAKAMNLRLCSKWLR